MIAQCRCPMFAGVPDGGSYACLSPATQEDLLCDGCRATAGGTGACIWIGASGHASVLKEDFRFSWNRSIG